MAYFFDGAVIMILIVTALTGYCKGFVRYVITMLGTVAAVLVAFLIANMSAENVYNKYFKTQLITSLENAAEQTDLSKLVSNELKNEGVDIDLSDEEIKNVLSGAGTLAENTEKLPLACVSLFMVNEIEAAQLAGTDANADFEDTLTALRAKYPNASVVMTVGADGVLYDGEEGRFQLPAFKVKAVDTTAAGDTFTGYFLTCLLQHGMSPAQALEYASKASSLAVSVQGAARSIPTMEEVRSCRLVLQEETI